MSYLGLEPLAWGLIAYCAVLSPVVGHFELNALRRSLAAGVAGARRAVYERTMLFQWGMTLLLLCLWVLLDRDLGAIGLVPRLDGWALSWSLVALAGTAVFVRKSLQTAGDPEQLEALLPHIGDLTPVIPHDRVELRRFEWLSLTAGVCEEFLYRGVLMGLLAAAFGAWPALLVSALVFGVGHAYQGPAGILRTAGIGLVFGIVVVLTGSLYVAIVAHAAIDVAQGRMLHAAVSAAPSRVASAS